MSPARRKGPEDASAEGWEDLAEEAPVGKLAENAELEAALQEAADAVTSRERGRPSAHEPPGEGEGEILLRDTVETEFLDEEVDRLRDELTRTKDQLLRLQADFDNFRRRALKERQETLQYGHQNLVKDLLSTVDNLDRAIDHAQLSGSGDLENLLQGVELVRRELLLAMANHGVHEIEALGKPFDPALHEAMGQVAESSVAPNTVIEVLQKGYQLRDRLVRPSRVVVARAPEGAQDGEGGAG